MSMGAKMILRVLLPLIVVAIGVMGAGVMIANRPKPAKAVTEETVTPVKVATVASFEEPVTITAGGTVQAAESIRLRPRVSGEVVWLSPNLVPGGRFAKGEVMLRLDRRDYELRLAQRKGELARAEFEVTNERGLAAVAAREWALLGEEVEATEEGRALTLRKPQLARAEANLAAAESAVAQAELDLSRTRVVAPFNALVGAEGVDLGQLVNSQTEIAVLSGTDRYWVQASIPIDELAHMKVPDSNGMGGSEARVSLRSDGVAISKTGKVVRLLGDLEQAGRMARVLIEIEDPLEGGDGTRLPLLLNAYVSVEIVGEPLADVVAVPAIGLREGNKVWVMNGEQRLEIRKVTVAREEREQVLVRMGIEAGETVVVSRIPAPIPGMKLKQSEARAESPLARTPGGER